MAENIKVAVRVRPFNNREEKRGPNLVVQMSGQSTTVVNPNNATQDKHTFTYDHSYWSHDGFDKEPDGKMISKSKNYVEQTKVFQDLGVPMLENAWSGYNCSIFAYGQTGSGKSYSIVGHGPNAGLVPRTCEKLFQDIEKRASPDLHYEVNFSMLEIYNENVRDLLNLTKTKSLPVRMRPDKGFFVDGLTTRTVRSYDDIRLRMSEGEKKRTIAATKMNETSSRAHTIVAINFAQNDLTKKTTKLAVINLVDLAGSERVKQTAAEGDRFEEAKNINKSLLNLGIVLKSLCDQASGKKITHIPYQDSILTKLLKNALGGNSKTVMIAAIGPDAENYEQTLSTLRYADRAKSIKTRAQVNTAATDKMIQELIAEKERLLQELREKKGADPEDMRKAREEHENEIRHYKAQMVDMKQAWEEEFERVRKEMEEMKLRELQEQEEEKRLPHLMNLNEDPALCGKVNHIIRKGTFILGNGKQDVSPDILLTGPRVVSEHAVIMHKNNKVFLDPKKGLVLHNGRELTSSVQLHHQDRVQFGSRNLFVFNHPEAAEQLLRDGKKLREITYEFAQDEIARCQGLLDLDNEDEALREEVMSIMQVVQDVNAMAEELDKHATFNIVLVSPDARCAEDGGRTEVYVRMLDLETENEYLWDRNKFLVRQSHMQEMYGQFEDLGTYPEVEQERDPFWEPPDMDVLIGVVPVPMNYIAHTLAFDEEALQIIDYRAQRIGFLKVEFIPCTIKGHEDDPSVTEDPMDLVGRPLTFKIKLVQALNLPNKYVRSWCRYRFYEESTYEYTDRVVGSNPMYGYGRVIKLAKGQVDHKFIDYLNQKPLAIEIWGQQADAPSPKKKRPDERSKMKEELEQQKKNSDKLKAKLDKITKIVESGPKTKEMLAIKKILKE